MNALPAEAFSERLPSKVEIANADQLRRILVGTLDEEGRTTLNLATQPGETAQVTLTPAIAQTFLDVLRLIASGKGFRVIPLNAQLTTQEAADLLNVSRPFLIKLLEEGAIPFTKTNRHRRVSAEALLAYKAERDAKRAQALSDMAAFDAEEGLL